MHIVGVLAGVTLILLVLIDGFESILQPRRVVHRFRYARFYYRTAWSFWRRAAVRIRSGKRRQAFLSTFGPLSLLGLFTTWVVGLIVGFALIHFSAGSPLHLSDELGPPTFETYLYLSGTTIFTLGYGDVTPISAAGRALAVIESGMGFAFLAAVIGYFPVLYQAFSQREVVISLLDARAGSPPSGGQVLLRLAQSGHMEGVDTFLKEWERWSAELLESHLSFPVLSYYRSQHDNQSWLAALATMLDTSAMLLVVTQDINIYQAQLTFAMARHAAVDLALVLKIPPATLQDERLPTDRFEQMHAKLLGAKLHLCDAADAIARLAELRRTYEPFLNALSKWFLVSLPPVIPEHPVPDNWQRSAWMPLSPGIGQLPAVQPDDEHFR